MTAFYTYLTAGGSKTWEELIEPTPSPVGEYTRENRTITRAFRVPIAQTNALIAECFPTLSIPGRHPVLTGMYVNRVGFGPMPGETLTEVGNHSEPENYLISVTYGPLEIGMFGSQNPPTIDPTQPIDLMIGNISCSMEAVSIPKYTMKWDSDDEQCKETGTGDDMAAYINVPRTQFTVMLPRQSSIPWVAHRVNRGKVNKNQFFGAKPETVLYVGMQVSYRFSNDGSRQFDVEHSFDEKAINYGTNTYGWNHVWNTVTQAWDKPYRGSSSDKKFIYELSDKFNDLIKFS